MRGKGISPSHNPSKTKFRNYSLRNRSITSNDKDFDKMFEEMKKSVINEIVKEAEIKFNEHKDKLINFINNYRNNESTQTLEIDEEKNFSKITRTKKKTEKNSSNVEPIDESEQSSKFPHLQNKNKRNAKSPMPKLVKKNNKKDSLLLTPEINKKDLDDEIAESNATDTKLSKKAKKKPRKEHIKIMLRNQFFSIVLFDFVKKLRHFASCTNISRIFIDELHFFNPRPRQKERGMLRQILKFSL
jgi:hypothetical protein